MKILLLALAAVAVVVMQGTLLYRAPGGDVAIDLCLLLVMAVAWQDGPQVGCLVGLWVGALLGASLGELAAPTALLYGLAGWTSGQLATLSPHRSLWAAACLGATMAVCMSGLQALGVVALGLQRQLPVGCDPETLPWSLVGDGVGLAIVVALWASLSPEKGSGLARQRP
jgi:hypothetical protein